MPEVYQNIPTDSIVSVEQLRKQYFGKKKSKIEDLALKFDTSYETKNWNCYTAFQFEEQIWANIVPVSITSESINVIRAIVQKR